MPIYEYICQDCGQETEVIQRFSDPPLAVCGSCSGRLEKKISVSSFHLKGSGWYLTDYARKNSGNSTNSPSKSGSTESGNGNGTGSESKADKDSKRVADAPAAAKSEAKSETKSDSKSTSGS
jgi:putative FmdB family regulatory protein